MDNDPEWIEQTPENLQEAVDDLMVLIGRFEHFNAPTAADQNGLSRNPTRSRELSVSITELKSGLLWARHALVQFGAVTA